MEKIFKSPYPKPVTLSDPYYDFSTGMLGDLLKKDIEDLTWSDYSSLFGPHLPAGTYEEVMYYLPSAVLYLSTHEDDALDLVTPIFGFCSKNIEKLRNDDLDIVVKEKIAECLKIWTSKFKILHFDKNACLKKGWGLEYNDYVVNAETICEATSDLFEFETLREIAITFTKSLAYHNGDVTKASWFLEYSRSRFDVYTPPNDILVNGLLSDEKLLNEAYAVVWSEVMKSNQSPTYWKDTLNELGI